VLTATTDRHRTQSMMEAVRKLRIPHSPGAPLFFFTTRNGNDIGRRRSVNGHLPTGN